MTDAVRRMLMGLAQEDYMKAVEKRKAEERELEAEIQRRKEFEQSRQRKNNPQSDSSTKEPNKSDTDSH